MSNKEKKKNPYQDTLNLPKTEFSIRANAAKKEPEILDKWKEDDLYLKTWNKNKEEKKYVLHDGPPYANGNIHMGHVLNKVLKDFVTKFKRMSGYHVPVKPGWDCHGLPIELKVIADFNKTSENKKQQTKWNSEEKLALKKACREYANKWINIQKKEFENLGVVMNWNNPYITMNPKYEANILRAFAMFVDGGYIQRKGKSVPWCASCQTVLATAEIEYKDRKDPSIYVLFPFSSDISKKLFPEVIQVNPDLNINFLIWTTTPWTLPLNRAVVLSNVAQYVLLKHPEKNLAFIVAKDLADKICSILGIEKDILAIFSSNIFEGKKVKHPFIQNLQVPVILDDSVLLDEGTACVHTAPGCGPEDYFIGVKNNLEIFSPLSADGKYTLGIEPKDLEGMSVRDGQIWVLKKLTEKNRLLHKANIKHSYPHCWRCHTGLIFRATDQWFCNLQKNNLIPETLKTIESIDFIPAWGKKRLDSFINNRTEWCISRQRIWGVPIPALLCKKCDNAYISKDFIEKIATNVEREGIEFWDKTTIEQMQYQKIVPTDFKCEKCNNSDLSDFKKETDILDVWFDSGVSHYAVLDQDPKNLGVPADIYLEGSDQHRGWFQSSLLSSMIINKKTCTKEIITHGFVVDAKGYKMSKSLGNVILPDQVINKYSRDILRLWVASSDYHGDISISENILKNVSEVYRKIRNTCRFMLSNLYDFDPLKDAVEYEQLLKIDQYALANLFELNDKVLSSYNQSDFAAVYYYLNNYCSNQLSSLYLDISKDRLYVEKAGGHLRRSAQTTIYLILDVITHLMAPIMSFLAEELSDYYQRVKTKSIHLQSFLFVTNIWELLSKKEIPSHLKAIHPYVNLADLQAFSDIVKMRLFWNILEQLRDAVLKELEQKRQQGIIKHSLGAKVEIFIEPSSDQKQQIDKFLVILKDSKESVDRFFKDWLIVSKCDFVNHKENLSKTDFDWIYVKVSRADGVKCPRCWQWEKTDHENGLCSRCYNILNNTNS
ncbi:isoleucine--tRNA ligase [Candidatus Dependentiae bacterium]|nr:isoleucine--tRNA ligase [Candidatus Dependentiae bacterium]